MVFWRCLAVQTRVTLAPYRALSEYVRGRRRTSLENGRMGGGQDVPGEEEDVGPVPVTVSQQGSAHPGGHRGSD